ncbi:MAG: lipid kinase, partial [Leptolyngbya sp. SIO4C1]|nr:lipid kinase [Leptolyngbya sp. SIO4C1]
MTSVAHLIFNPISGRGDAETDLDCLRSQLSAKFEVIVHQTTPEQAAHTLAEQALSQGADLVIASGGDGTVSATANALIGSGIPMGIVPRGTANAIAAALNIPNNLVEACQII